MIQMGGFLVDFSDNDRQGYSESELSSDSSRSDKENKPLSQIDYFKITQMKIE